MPLVDQIISSIQKEGGRPFFVGGAVRDSLLGKISSDVDIEVYGLTSEKLEEILAQFGNTNLVGKSFGVIKFQEEDVQIDISLPRRERLVGAGHKDFDIFVDPNMDLKEACSRRDFTINAMMKDPAGNIYDFFCGQDDLKNKTLRHVSPLKFVEDPLRPLRAVQFAARFDLSINESTVEICKELLPQFKTLPKERIWGEFQKWTTSKYPAKGLDALNQIGWIIEFPELNSIIGIDQDPIWHPEEDVWTHTLRTINMATNIADRDGLVGEDREVLLFAALCHDFGKPLTTEFIEGRIRSRRHAKEGEVPTRSFLDRIGATPRITDRVVPLVVEHMIFVNDMFHETTIRRLAVRLHPESIQMLVRLIEADHGSKAEEEWTSKDKILELAQKVQVDLAKPKPILLGRHLIPMGISPGPGMGKILKEAFEAQLDGVFNTEAGALEWAACRTQEAQQKTT